MGLVYDDQIPTHVPQLLDVGFSFSEVKAGDDLVLLFPEGLPETCVHRFPVRDYEGFVELFFELAAPLIGQIGGGDDKHALDLASVLEFLQKEARHDRLSSAGIVGE